MAVPVTLGRVKIGTARAALLGWSRSARDAYHGNEEGGRHDAGATATVRG